MLKNVRIIFEPNKYNFIDKQAWNTKIWQYGEGKKYERIKRCDVKYVCIYIYSGCVKVSVRMIMKRVFWVSVPNRMSLKFKYIYFNMTKNFKINLKFF